MGGGGGELFGFVSHHIRHWAWESYLGHDDLWDGQMSNISQRDEEQVQEDGNMLKSNSGGKKWSITDIMRNLFKKHTQAHIKHTTRRRRLLSGSHLVPLPLCSSCSASCSSRFALFLLYCLPLRHLNILYVAWCCFRDVSRSLIRQTVIDLLLEHSKASTVSSQRKRQSRQAHWTRTNQ